MRSKRIMSAVITAAVTLCAICGGNASAGRISDFFYDDEKGAEGIFVANRYAEKCVALTFDDGPHPTYTAEILDILKENGTRATFFIIGQNAEQYPEIVLREYSEGHEIGNHTYSHPNMKALDVNKLDEEIEKTQKVIKDITGSEPRLFRPPGGYLKNDFVEATIDRNCTSVLWSWRQDTRDWSCPSVNSIVKTVLGNIQNGDIILFHDFNGGKSPTPEALRIILPKLREMGYRFVTVSELMDDAVSIR